MRDCIKKIINGEEIEDIFSFVENRIFKNGPVSTTDMEILSLLKLYQPDYFNEREHAILNYMGIFYKDSKPKTLKEVLFRQYRKHIEENYNHTYTPVQASIVKGIKVNKCFSFSAPTSTGKSYVFLNQIKSTVNSVVIVVPSRALINEYYLKLSELIDDTSVNVLTFIDRINTKNSTRNVFIVTPERCRELFRQKDNFNIDLFLFDEAQLSNENSKRGLYFDSIVRRCNKAYPEASFIFAHPFVKNPESQIEKNHFETSTANSIQYTQKNVGQIFMCIDKDWNFFHFGIEKPVLGNRKQICSYDPIKRTIENNGSVLFYISKSKIYNRRFLEQFRHYIEMCDDIDSSLLDPYLNNMKEYTGGETETNKNRYSQMLSLLKKGIVIHHGSLPLYLRILIEQFTKAGLCRICFATSTLEQGINMPFDVVFLDRLEGSKPLSVKNLIGRAGRSTTETKFDFGYVVLSSASRMSGFRRIMTQDEELDNVSSLEKEEIQGDDFNDFKEAILNGTYSDEYNLTEKDLEKLTSTGVDEIIKNILDTVFINNKLISLEDLNNDSNNRLELYFNFRKLYAIYLGRNLEDGEGHVLDTAIKILLWKVHGKTFKNICWYRYSHASRSNERRALRNNITELNKLQANFITGYHGIPDKNHPVYSLFSLGTKAIEVDYDLIMYDTYDFIDKLIGFKLSDVFYAAFIKYFETTGDPRAEKMSKYIKFGTDNDRHIWMLRYGMSFEDMEALEPHIKEISAEEIVFFDSISDVPDEKKISISRFIKTASNK